MGEGIEVQYPCGELAPVYGDHWCHDLAMKSLLYPEFRWMNYAPIRKCFLYSLRAGGQLSGLRIGGLSRIHQASYLQVHLVIFPAENPADN